MDNYLDIIRLLSENKNFDYVLLVGGGAVNCHIEKKTGMLPDKLITNYDIEIYKNFIYNSQNTKQLKNEIIEIIKNKYKYKLISDIGDLIIKIDNVRYTFTITNYSNYHYDEIFGIKVQKLDILKESMAHNIYNIKNDIKNLINDYGNNYQYANKEINILNDKLLIYHMRLELLKP